MWAGVSALGIGIGPITGGFLLEHFWWGSVFLVNVPDRRSSALVLGYFLVPESQGPARTPQLDPLGAVLSIVGLGALLWAIIEAPSHGLDVADDPRRLRDRRRARSPRSSCGSCTRATRCSTCASSRTRASRAASGAITLVFLALFGTLFLLTQYLQSVLGYSTVEGRRGAAPAVGRADDLRPAVARGGCSGSATRSSSRPGCSSSPLSLAAHDDVPDRHRSAVRVIAVTVLMGVGMANVMAPATESIMGSLPRAKAGVGSAVNDTTRQVGGAVGVAVLGSILASAFRPKVGDLLRGTVPGSLLAKVEDSLGSALGVARDVPAGATVRRQDRRRRPDRASSAACTPPCSWRRRSR